MPEHSPSHRVGAFAIIFDDQGQVLVSRRVDSGWFNLPGGGVEPDESVEEGLIRELREEASLDVEVGRLVGVYSKPQKHEVVLTFEARIIGGTPTPSDESDLHIWIAPQDLGTINILPKHRERIEDACLKQAAAIIKDQRQPSLRAAEAEAIGGM